MITSLFESKRVTDVTSCRECDVCDATAELECKRRTEVKLHQHIDEHGINVEIIPLNQTLALIACTFSKYQDRLEFFREQVLKSEAP